MSAKSYSELDTFGRCPWKYKLKYIDNLQSKTKTATLHEGSIQHLINQEVLLWIRQFPARNPRLDMWIEVEAAVQALMDEGKELRFPQEQAEHEELVRTCVRRTQRWLDDWDYFDGWAVLHVEEQFTMEMDNGVEITCTPDLVLLDRNGIVWCVDLKTAATIPEEGDVEPTLQTRINLAAVRTVYPSARGFIFDFMRKKEPVEPELIKDGSRISRLNQVDTDFRTLSDFIERTKPALFDDPDTKARLAELRLAGNDKWFKRFTLFLSDAELDRSLEDVLRAAATLEVVEEGGLWYRVWQEDFGYKRCSRCEFHKLCVGELKGGDTEQIIEQFYEPRDTSYKEYETEGEE